MIIPWIEIYLIIQFSSKYLILQHVYTWNNYDGNKKGEKDAILKSNDNWSVTPFSTKVA